MKRRSAFVHSFARDLRHRRSAKITLNKNVMGYFADPEHLSFKTCSKRYWVCLLNKRRKEGRFEIGNNYWNNKKGGREGRDSGGFEDYESVKRRMHRS